MKKFVYMTLAAVALMACQPKEPEFLTTDKGPAQTVTCDAAALMGSDFVFSVNLQDEIALSTHATFRRTDAQLFAALRSRDPAFASRLSRRDPLRLPRQEIHRRGL